jgi:2-dehydro-3-deoxygalactonokinase
MNCRGTRFLAIDWGTTNRRIFRIEAGKVTARERDGRGAASLDPQDFARDAADIRARHDGLPILAAGMVGSRLGWQEVPYCIAPATLSDLAQGLITVSEGVRIVPGVAQIGNRPDVMRGEEVQFLGAAACGLVPAGVLLCQPGTHSKWATIVDGALAGFTTAMTGELFALLTRHSLLASQLGVPVVLGPAFLAGIEEARLRDLSASIFGIRAQGLLGMLPDGDASSFASGLLIGAEVAARLSAACCGVVYILANATLGSLYVAAIRALECEAHLIDSDEAFISGMVNIWDLST